MNELLHFALEHAGHRDAGPLGHDARDIVFVDFFLEQGALLDGLQLLLGGLNLFLDLRKAAVTQLCGSFPVAGGASFVLVLAQVVELFFELANAGNRYFFAVPALFETSRLAAQAFEFVFHMAEPLPRGGVLLLAEGQSFDFEVSDAPVDLVDFDRHRADLQAQRGTGLVDQIDGLVGQEAVGDVALREDRCRHDRRVLNANAMVDLIFFFETAQDGDGVVDARLTNQDRLEAAG